MVLVELVLLLVVLAEILLVEVAKVAKVVMMELVDGLVVEQVGEQHLYFIWVEIL
jgi:hypothetical protein